MMKNIVQLASLISVIYVSDVGAATICPKEIGNSDLKALEGKETVTINSIELKNTGPLYLNLGDDNKAKFKASDFTNNKNEELCTYSLEGQQKSFTLIAKGTLPMPKKPSLLPRALSRAP
jgi:hypothetical protein